MLVFTVASLGGNAFAPKDDFTDLFIIYGVILAIAVFASLLMTNKGTFPKCEKQKLDEIDKLAKHSTVVKQYVEHTLDKYQYVIGEDLRCIKEMLNDYASIKNQEDEAATTETAHVKFFNKYANKRS
jgi:hypothetical protein